MKWEPVKRTPTSTRFHGSAMIHYGGDFGVPDVYRNGTLYFYYNTVAITATKTNVGVCVSLSYLLIRSMPPYRIM
jgi:hypothetical protein